MTAEYDWLSWAGPAASLLLAAGYLAATARRGRRPAILALGGVALLGLYLMRTATGYDLDLFVRLFADDAKAALVWTNMVNVSAGYAMLVWAVLADRPPPADEE